MKYLPFILLVLVTSCISQKKCLERFPPIIVHDTLYGPGTVFFGDTIIYVEIPGDTAFVESPWLDNTRWTDDFTSLALEGITVSHNIEQIRADVPFAYSLAWVENNTFKMQLIQKDSILAIVLDSIKQFSTDTIRIEVKEIVEKEVVPKKYGFFKNGFWILLGLIVLVIILAFVFIKIK